MNLKWNSSLRKSNYIKNDVTWNSFMMLHGTQFCCNVLIEFNTLEYHVKNSHSTHTHTATIVDLSPTIALLSISFNFLFFNFYLNFIFSHWLPVCFSLLTYLPQLSKSCGMGQLWKGGENITRNSSFINSSSKWIFLIYSIIIDLSFMSNSSF